MGWKLICFDRLNCSKDINFNKAYRMFLPPLGRRWKDMRATLSGSFSSSKIKNMFNLMNAAAENFVQFFSNKKEEVVEVEMRDTFAR